MKEKKIFAGLDQKYASNLELLDLDVTNIEQRNAMVENLKVKGIDILVNNAGVGHFGPLEDITDENLHTIFETNLLGMMKLTRDLLPILRQKKGSRIINISSAFGFMGFPLTSLYCATKFGVEGFSQALAYEMKPHGVDVFTVRPGGFRTKFLESACLEKATSEIYAQQMAGMQNFQAHLASRKNPPDPMKVVYRMVKMIEGDINHSIVVGSDAKASWIFKKILPDFIYGFIMNMVSNRIFARQKVTHV